MNATADHSLPQPTLRFMLSHPAHFISLGFGSGLAPFAPGTFGTLLGLFLTRWIQPEVSDEVFFMGLAAAFVTGLEGDFHAVVGLSPSALRGMAAELGVPLSELWAAPTA